MSKEIKIIDNHYKFDVHVPVEPGETYGTIRVDPYLVAKLWGITDPAHFHILKTICRFGTKPGNTKERESAAIDSAIQRGKEADQALYNSKLIEDGEYPWN